MNVIIDLLAGVGGVAVLWFAVQLIAALVVRWRWPL